MKKLLPLILLLPEIAHAEVMDKEPSLLSVWGMALIAGVAMFAAARFRPWLLVVVVPLAALFSYGLLAEVTDQFVGPAILREAGNVYIASTWLAPLVAVGGALLGWWLRRRYTSAQQGAPVDVAKRRA